MSQAFSGTFRNVEDGEVVATVKDCAYMLFELVTDFLGKIVDLIMVSVKSQDGVCVLVARTLVLRLC